MFSGIIESMGIVRSKETHGSNVRIGLNCSFLSELKIDQSIAHNGVCLTVSELGSEQYYVDVIEESLQRSNLGSWKVGQEINLERSITLNDFLDGHLVQGHVDQVAKTLSIDNKNGSWVYAFQFVKPAQHVIIEKGSITVNGVSLTISKLRDNGFEVSIIPYSFENTNFKSLKINDLVNIEFDVIGKYVEKISQLKK